MHTFPNTIPRLVRIVAILRFTLRRIAHGWMVNASLELLELNCEVSWVSLFAGASKLSFLSMLSSLVCLIRKGSWILQEVYFLLWRVHRYQIILYRRRWHSHMKTLMHYFPRRSSFREACLRANRTVWVWGLRPWRIRLGSAPMAVSLHVSGYLGFFFSH